MSSSACADSGKVDLQSKLSACRSTELCRPSAAWRAYTSSRMLVELGPVQLCPDQLCEHSMGNGPVVRRQGAWRIKVLAGKDFSLVFCYYPGLTALTVQLNAKSLSQNINQLDQCFDA